MCQLHATPAMLNAAMQVKPPGDHHKVLAVVGLTDSNEARMSTTTDPANFNGIVCPVHLAHEIQLLGGKPEGKIIVCPGIRPAGTTANNHVRPATPAEAVAAGAEYIVVGRPITDAPDPIAAARSILNELALAETEGQAEAAE